jgi:hypothetical protein
MSTSSDLVSSCTAIFLSDVAVSSIPVLSHRISSGHLREDLVRYSVAEHQQSSRLSIRLSRQPQVARGNFRVLKWGFPFSKSRLTVQLGVGLDCSILSWLSALKKDFKSLTALFFHRGTEA